MGHYICGLPCDIFCNRHYNLLEREKEVSKFQLVDQIKTAADHQVGGRAV